MKTLIFTTILLAIYLNPAFAMSKEGCGGECASCHVLTSKEAGSLLSGMGGGKVSQVKPSQVKGLWEVTLAQGSTKATVYVDYGKKHIIPGAIFSIATRKPISGSPSAPPKPQKVKFSDIPLKNSIILGNPQGKKKLVLFTDPDCPFCVKQHAELNKLLAKNNDLAVYVKLNPLKIHPNAYNRSRVILHSASSKILDDAFSGKMLPPVTPQTSSSAVDETMKLAQSLGITSTPTLVLPDGRVLVGFQEMTALEKMIGGKK